jgi:hypothetical protein
VSDNVVPSIITRKVVTLTIKTSHGGCNGITRDSTSIRVNNFAIHTVILYFTVLMDKPMLDQIKIAGGHLGGGGGSGNDGSDEGPRRRAAVAGRLAVASAATAAAGGGGVLMMVNFWRWQWHWRRGDSWQGDRLWPLALLIV